MVITRHRYWQLRRISTCCSAPCCSMVFVYFATFEYETVYKWSLAALRWENVTFLTRKVLYTVCELTRRLTEIERKIVGWWTSPPAPRDYLWRRFGLLTVSVNCMYPNISYVSHVHSVVRSFTWRMGHSKIVDAKQRSVKILYQTTP